MKRYLLSGLIGAAFILLLLWLTGVVQVYREQIDGQFYQYVVGNKKYIDPKPSLDDGPYVFWSGDTLAYISSLCGDDPLVETVPVRSDTLRFADPCEPEQTYAVAAAPPAPDPAIFHSAPRVFAVSDVEGHYDEFIHLLQAAGVVDEAGHWTWSDGHLVLVGDFVDRGSRVTEVLWLIHRLEQEARREGGRVHYVLGNHEALLLHGDDRHAHTKYKLAAPRFGASLAGLFGPETELGRWLRSKPAMVRIDSVLFVHAGMSPALAESGLDLAAVNEKVREGLLEPQRLHNDSTLAFLFGRAGPLWYRGYFDDEMLQAATVAEALSRYGASAAVVGHAIVERVQWLQDGRVVAIDVTFTEPDRTQGLLIENGRFYRVNASGRQQPF